MNNLPLTPGRKESKAFSKAAASVTRNVIVFENDHYIFLATLFLTTLL
jgi:hypothetical protein